MKITILDAQHTLFEGIVSMATLPGLDGELSILDDHESLFAVLTKGYIRLEPVIKKTTVRLGPAQKTEDYSEIKPIFVHQGLARMKNNELVILVE